MKYFRTISQSMFLFLLACPLWGQVSKDNARKALWHEPYANKISNDGTWLSYRLLYEQAQDSLYVVSLRTGVKKGFPLSWSGVFSNDSRWYAFRNEKSELKLLDLKRDTDFIYPNVKSHQFSATGRYLVMLLKESSTEESNGSLRIKDLQENKSYYFPGVHQYILNKNDLYFLKHGKQESSFGKIDLSDVVETIIYKSNKGKFNFLVTNKNKDAFAVLQEYEVGDRVKQQLYYYGGGQFKTLDQEETSCIQKEGRIMAPDFGTSMVVSNDGERVIFGVEVETVPKENDDKAVEIWHWNDPWLQPRHEEMQQLMHSAKIVVWWPQEEKCSEIAKAGSEQVVLTGDQEHALIYDPLKNEPQFKFRSDIDVYVQNLTTGKRKLLLEKQEYKYDKTMVSPGGKYISYFKDQHWWVYNLKTGSRTNVSKGLPFPVYNIEHDIPGEASPYGFAGWTKEDGRILIYDEFDIWNITPDGKKYERLTYGRENGIRYRFPKHIYSGMQVVKDAASGFEAKAYDLEEKEIVEMFSDKTKESGFAVLKLNNKVKILSYGGQKMDNIISSKDDETFIYRVQNYDKPHSLIYYNIMDEEQKKVFQSNEHQKKMEWGHSELITYQDEYGKQLQGALFYPSNFEAGNQYPMIVNIYEDLSNELHQFVNPDGISEVGFNISSYTQDGYLVLLPELTYKVGSPGMSAYHNVMSAVEAVKAKGIVEEENVGLIGHSFGGYETSFIITQTDFFKTAVAGAPFTDLVSWYLSIGWNNGRSEIWRFEHHQERMGLSLYEDMSGYLANSPVHQADKITTPLLIWTGKEDGQVHWFQSLELYLALRRLNKQAVLLSFPEERHIVFDEEKAEQLQQKLKEWFNYYLKAQPAKEWIIGSEGL